MRFRVKKSKFANVKVDGFDSKKENKRYGQLKMAQLAGKITDLQKQPKFILQKGFTDNEGNKIRDITYTADFKYFNVANSVWIVEDVKGFKTDVYKIKAKMFKFKFPQYRFIET